MEAREARKARLCRFFLRRALRICSQIAVAFQVCVRLMFADGGGRAPSNDGPSASVRRVGSAHDDAARIVASADGSDWERAARLRAPRRQTLGAGVSAHGSP